MADQTAEVGEEVLFFSLEQSRLEMVSKSLSRLTAKMNQSIAVTSLKIRSGYVDDAVLDAIEVYREKIGERMSIIEGNFSCTVSFIGQYVRRYIDRTGVKPVVIVDYLQILQADEGKRQTTKELIDSNVTELKRISRNCDVPVFVISSLNRSNYLSPVDFESFKESGGIEYTCDVLWGLQLQVINDDLFNKENKLKEKRELIRKSKSEVPRKIELICLKNRYGISSYRVGFNYFPQYDLFQPIEPLEPLQRSARRI
jgi:replicative DNA helicase